MPRSDVFKKRLQYARALYSREVGKKKLIRDDIEKMKTDIQVKKHMNKINEQASVLLRDVSAHVRGSITTFLEDAITDALQHVSKGQYECKIALDESRGKPSAEIYVSEMINGIESLQDPEAVCGGSFVDTISVAFLQAYMALHTDPEIKGPVLFDEPGKMVSENMSINFAEFMKNMSIDFSRQVIMSTHNQNIKNSADHVIEIEKRNGKSVVTSP